MNTIEHEAKILNIDIDTLRSRLNSLGAEKKGSYVFRRYVFDTIPEMPNRWVRLRSDGTETTLTVKQINSSTIDGTEEWEVRVSDFDTALIILEKIGIKPRGYQENTREEYDLSGVQVSIDHWPRLDPYVEVEAADSDEVIKTAKLLGYNENELVTDNTSELYRANGIDIQKIPELKFEETK